MIQLRKVAECYSPLFGGGQVPAPCLTNICRGISSIALDISCLIRLGKFPDFNPFAPGDFVEKRVLKLVEWFSGHCRAIKS